MVVLAALDYVILAVLAVSGVIALIRGLTREVLSIIGWLAAFYGALFALPLLREPVRNVIRPDWIADGVVLFVAFVATLIGFSLAAKVLTDRLKKSPIGILDRILGLFFGLARGMVIVSFAYLILSLLLPPDDHPDWVRDAKATPAVKFVTAVLIKVIPFDNLSDRMPDIDDLMKPDALKNVIEGNRSGLPANLSDNGNAAGYNEKSRESLDKLIKEVVR